VGEDFPKVFRSFVLLIMRFLSQAGRLDGLHRASPVPFRGSYFTLSCIRQRYAPTAQCRPRIGPGLTSFQFCTSWRTEFVLPRKGAHVQGGMTLTNYFVDWLAPHTNGKASVATYPPHILI
jgi:hypothetical protein